MLELSTKQKKKSKVEGHGRKYDNARKMFLKKEDSGLKYSRMIKDIQNKSENNNLLKKY